MNYRQLTENERYQIQVLMKAGHDQQAIAALLERHPATISRELRRNTGLRGYRPAQAQRLSSRRRQAATKACKLTAEVGDWIRQLVRQELSPAQVVAYLRRRCGVCLHHETVYRFIYADQANGGDLYQHLRVASKPYRKRYGHYDRRGRIPNRTSIHERPAVVDRRTRLGDWEGDTVMGKNRQSTLLTVVERKSLYTRIIKLAGKQAEQLAEAAVAGLHKLKRFFRTLTLDNGLEFAAHEKLADALAVDVYFADPYASWQRGINENTNGLIRQYFPKGTDFNEVSQAEIDHVMDRLNSRPRQTRGYRTPNEILLGQSTELLTA
ncbi:IS30 family transposase [Methylohalomonas lacus]|uniref:IS30 family transposase n=1 Tax=Methylohalomonas lacus TaxID=398773 RepID=A0AAE3HLU7_9GAMM|nr:IS30 family transposase [Methylohalomonas lacus]MCS3904639.1 IS30 family transposase [Methylohalomonas lacus]